MEDLSEEGGKENNAGFSLSTSPVPPVTWDGIHLVGRGAFSESPQSAVNLGEKEKQVCFLQPPGQRKEKGSQKQPSARSLSRNTLCL